MLASEGLLGSVENKDGTHSLTVQVPPEALRQFVPGDDSLPDELLLEVFEDLSVTDVTWGPVPSFTASFEDSASLSLFCDWGRGVGFVMEEEANGGSSLDIDCYTAEACEAVKFSVIHPGAATQLPKGVPVAPPVVLPSVESPIISSPPRAVTPNLSHLPPAPSPPAQRGVLPTISPSRAVNKLLSFNSPVSCGNEGSPPPDSPSPPLTPFRHRGRTIMGSLVRRSSNGWLKFQSPNGTEYNTRAPIANGTPASSCGGPSG